VAGKSLASVESECDEGCAVLGEGGRATVGEAPSEIPSSMQERAPVWLSLLTCLVAMVPSAVHPRERRNQHT